MLNKDDEKEHSYLFPYRKNTWIFLAQHVMFFITAAYQIEEVSFYIYFGRFLNHNNGQFCNLFLVDNVIYFAFSAY